jgi:2-methylcitrate dehydratase PrpD
MSAPATRRLGEFVASLRERELPAVVEASARCHLLYNLVCGLAGASMVGPACSVVAGLRPGEATVIASGERVPAEHAAFTNAVLLHARAQDDTHLPSECHPGAVIIPVALALAERESSTPRAFLTAMIAGYEVTAAVGEPFAHDAIQRGFRASMVFGTLGAAAAAGSILGLDAGQIANAIALSTSFAGGLGQSWIEGSTEWMYHMGAAARNGIVAARLANVGEKGAPYALEGVAGYARAFAGHEEWEPPTDWGLGERWRIVDVIYKPYPVCNVTQNPVALACRLADAHDLIPEQILGARLYLNPTDRSNPGTLNWGPFTGIASTLMSAPYCVAMALKHRTATLVALHEWDDPVVTAMVARVQVLPDDELPPLGARLELETLDGRRLTDEIVSDASSFKGDWRNVLETARRLGPEMPDGGAGLDGLADMVHRLEDLGDMQPIVDAVTVQAASNEQHS